MAFLKPTMIVVKVPGVQGPPGTGGTGGTGGTTWLSGATVPLGSLGAIGNWYLNTSNGDTYEKTGTTTWTKRGDTKASQSSVETLATNINNLAPKANPTFTGTVSGVTKSHVGLGNVDNTSDIAKPVSTATQTALNLKSNTNHTHAANEVTNLVKASQDATAALLAAGSHTGIAFNYDSTNSRLSATVTVSGGTSTSVDPKVIRDIVAAALRGTTVTSAYDATAGTITLSSAVISVAGKTGEVALVKGDVGLGNVDNTSDAAKPVSTATQTALNLKANSASPTFTGTVSGVTKTHVGLPNVDNTSDANKPVSTATQTALNAKLATTAAYPLYIIQNSDGTWPARSTVSSEDTRVVLWIPRTAGGGADPVSGGVGLGSRDVYYKKDAV